MTNIFIECEGDIEFSINHCLSLALNGRKSFVTFGFPSDLMYDVFLNNLHHEVIKQGIPFMDVEAKIILPPKEDDNDECIGGG